MKLTPLLLLLILILAPNLALSGCRSANAESPLLENQLVSIRRSYQPPHQIHAADGNIGGNSRGDYLKLEIYRSARKAGGRRSGRGYGAAGLRRPPHKSNSPASSVTTTPPLFVLAATVMLLFFFLHFPSRV